MLGVRARTKFSPAQAFLPRHYDARPRQMFYHTMLALTPVRRGCGEGGCYFLVFVHLFEKYGTLIETCTALIEKVSSFRVKLTGSLGGCGVHSLADRRQRTPRSELARRRFAAARLHCRPSYGLASKRNVVPPKLPLRSRTAVRDDALGGHALSAIHVRRP